MAYDPATRQLVVFGGETATGVLGDTWTWNGTQWSQQSPTGPTPPARAGASMAFDQATGQLILFGGFGQAVLGDTWTWTGTQWTQLTPTGTTPAARADASLAYDTATSQLLLFGGYDGTLLGDTWTWSAGGWTQLSPTGPTPPARDLAAAAYDSAATQLVLFGGVGAAGILGDTWTWNGSAWAEPTVSGSVPPNRSDAAMAYGSGIGGVVLFGGMGKDGVLGDTWSWNGTGWSAQAVTGTTPSARERSAMVDYSPTGQLLLFGGEDTNGVRGDTWTFVPLPAVPAAPLVGAPVPGNGAATVAWLPGSADRAPITGYAVTPYVGTTAQPTQTFPTTTTSDTITGLTNGTPYTFQVAAINAYGTGPKSSRTTPLVVGAPAAPGYVSAAAGNGTATVKWLPASPDAAPITGYAITPYVGTTAQPTQTFPTTAATDTLTGLANGTTYTFRIAAINSYGTGPQSAATTPIAVGSPSAPGYQSAVPGNATATVRWLPGSPDAAPITGYAVTPYVGTVAQPTRTFSSPAAGDTVTGLANGTTYTFKIAAINSFGTGPQSGATAPVVVGVPSAPGLQSASPGNAAATVSWWPPSGSAAPLTGYVITPYIGTTAQAPQTYASTTAHQVVTGLVNGTSYTFKIAAIDSYGTGVQSLPTAAITVGAPVAPAAPTAAPGPGKATVSWVAPADNGSVVTGYKVTPYAAGVAQAPLTVAPTVTSQPITGLTRGVAYTFKVAAINARGTSPLSAPSPAVIPT